MKKLLISAFFAASAILASAQTKIYVAPSGDDSGDGSISRPFATIGRALDAAGTSCGSAVEIILREGRYTLSSTEVVTPSRIGGKPLSIRAFEGEDVSVGSFRELELNWKKSKKGVWKASCSVPLDQLYADGSRRMSARYPNYQEGALFGGTSADALSTDRIRSWKNPEGGIIHTLHYSMWGSQHYRITGKKGDEITYEGGHQVTRPSKLHPEFRYVENIREELDAPGEWFWDKSECCLYYIPLPGESPESVSFSTTTLDTLFYLEGSPENPIRNVHFRGIRFSGTERIFMKPYEMLLRSDWGIYRGAAILISGSEDCSVTDCDFEELGGHGVFISGYACSDTVKSNHIHHIGGSAICLVGSTSAVRSGSFGYENFVKYEDLDLTPGPANNLYPRHCLVEDNLIHDLGMVEKQVVGVEIQIAAQITIRHNSIYDLPRAGINIGDGAFGGHVIEYNDVFNTVLETGDHGAFNSWGRDRYWLPSYDDMTRQTEEHPEIILNDAIYTTIIRYNRFRCDHGWDIDLDDGSSNYHIYGNLCLHGGIKLREGFYRKVENNITVNNSLHAHVWFPQSHDVIRRNLFMQAYAPIGLNGYGETVDWNFFATEDNLQKSRTSMKGHSDAHSITGPFNFVDASSGVYSVTSGSAVFKVGFENIPMDRFGVLSPKLKTMAKVPAFPLPETVVVTDNSKLYTWQGAEVRSVQGLGDRSAHGLPDEKGVVVVSVPEGCPAAKAGIRKSDVIRSLDGSGISDVSALFSVSASSNWKNTVEVIVFRDQKQIPLSIRLE